MYIQKYENKRCFNYTLRPKQNDRDFPEDIFRHIFLKEKIEFWFKFLRILFLRFQLAISQHWLREWLCTEQTTGHYLNQCWPSSLTNICGTRVICVKEIRVLTCVIANTLLVVLIDLVSSLLSCIVVHDDWFVLSLSTFILRFTTLFLRKIHVEIHVS